MSQRDQIHRSDCDLKSLESHQAVQTSGGEGNQDKGESSHYSSYKRTDDPDREYSDCCRLKRSRPNQLSSGFKLFKNQQMSGQDSPFFTIPRSFQGETRIQGQQQDLLQPKEERVRPNDLGARLNERFQRNAILQEGTIEAIQESCAQLSKASEETNKELNEVFEEQHPCKRDRDCLDEDLNKLLNVYQNINPQPESHGLENPYHQEDIKPAALLVNKEGSPSKYQDGINMSYS
ncbi:hypothetical protein O181_027918 [Austropuccinia psidii MF-1]|uniref:Uncharacterized protein n=1 Tax=Austropuccinia psidii MF-1 TaxID=1389203 RepID=A0A9Q3CSQ0_9BASI|nr:hypothetical protein [Austropuccinia psidii MF-1]